MFLCVSVSLRLCVSAFLCSSAASTTDPTTEMTTKWPPADTVPFALAWSWWRNHGLPKARRQHRRASATGASMALWIPSPLRAMKSLRRTCTRMRRHVQAGWRLAEEHIRHAISAGVYNSCVLPRRLFTFACVCVWVCVLLVTTSPTLCACCAVSRIREPSQQSSSIVASVQIGDVASPSAAAATPWSVTIGSNKTAKPCTEPAFEGAPAGVQGVLMFVIACHEGTTKHELGSWAAVLNAAWQTEVTPATDMLPGDLSFHGMCLCHSVILSLFPPWLSAVLTSMACTLASSLGRRPSPACGAVHNGRPFVTAGSAGVAPQSPRKKFCRRV